MAMTGWEAKGSRLPWGHRHPIRWHRHPKGGAHLTLAESSSVGTSTSASGVHRHGEGSAPPSHRHLWGGGTTSFIQIAGEGLLGTAAGTATLWAVHCQKILESGVSRADGRVVTATLGAVPPPPCLVP